MDPFDRMICDLLEYLTRLVRRIAHIHLCHLDPRDHIGRCPRASEPAWIQFSYPGEIGRMARSAALLSMQARPSRWLSVTGFHRAIM